MPFKMVECQEKKVEISCSTRFLSGHVTIINHFLVRKSDFTSMILPPTNESIISSISSLQNVSKYCTHPKPKMIDKCV